MHYSPHDVFQLGPRLAPRLPEPGASEVDVSDVVYGIEGEFHRYIFSVSCTLGVVRAKERVTRVASFREPRGRTDPATWSDLEVCDRHGPLIEQYAHLHAQHPAVVEKERESPEPAKRET